MVENIYKHKYKYKFYKDLEYLGIIWHFVFFKIFIIYKIYIYILQLSKILVDEVLLFWSEFSLYVPQLFIIV